MGKDVSEKLYCPPYPIRLAYLLEVFRICDRERGVNNGSLQPIKTCDILTIIPDATKFELEVIRTIDDSYLKVCYG